jgi:hypothetical protein
METCPDDAGLGPKERARMRRQGLTWLEEELRSLREYLEKRPAMHHGAECSLQRWHDHLDLAPVRGAALEKLPAQERPGFRKLWADLDALLRRCESGQQGN